MNNDQIEGIAKATAEIVKVIPIYDDAVQPIAKEIGQALGTIGGVINIALSPLAAMVYGYGSIKDKLTSKLEKRLEKTLPENIIAPKLQLMGPLIEKYKYSYDSNELSDMFINLLANAMDKNTAEKAHPSFVNLISELSPDEARLIKTISLSRRLPKIDINRTVKVSNQSGHVLLYRNFTLLGYQSSLQYPELTPSYLSNLERLNIIQCSNGSMQDAYIGEGIYEPLEEHEEIKKLIEKSTEENKIEIKRGIITITDFGKMFINAVL